MLAEHNRVGMSSDSSESREVVIADCGIGNLGSVANTGAKCSHCGKKRKQIITHCPKCGEPWRGEVAVTNMLGPDETGVFSHSFAGEKPADRAHREQPPEPLPHR